jgi:hypothetical protein
LWDVTAKPPRYEELVKVVVWVAMRIQLLAVGTPVVV